MAEANERLRHARERTPSRRTPGACLGRQELAELVNEWIYRNRGQMTPLDKNYVGKLERGVIRWPDEAYRSALRAVLGAANDAQLGFFDTRRMPADTTPAERHAFLQAAADLRAGDPHVVGWPTMAAQHTVGPEGVDTNRRQILSSALGLLGAATPGAAWLYHRPGGEADATVDPAIVEHFAALRAVLVDSDSRLGAAWVLPTVGHQLAVIAELRRNVRGRLHDQLLSTESRWAEFAGWLSDDFGDPAAGERWLSRSLALAQEAGDRDFAAFLFARMAQPAAGSDREQDRILGLAQAASRVGTTHPYVQAFATLQRAHGHAFAGQTRAFEAAVDQARGLVGRRPVSADDLGSFCTIPYVMAQEAEGWLRLGRPRAAARRFGDALAMWPASYQRERGLYLSRAAAAHVADREPDQAATLALQAWELADVTRSSRVARQVVAVGRQLPQFGHRPATARLLAALEQAPRERW